MLESHFLMMTLFPLLPYSRQPAGRSLNLKELTARLAKAAEGRISKYALLVVLVHGRCMFLAYGKKDYETLRSKWLATGVSLQGICSVAGEGILF